MKKLLFIVLFFLSGCSFVDTYYVVSKDFINGEVEKIKGTNINSENLKVLYESLEIRLKKEKNQNFTITVLTTTKLPQEIYNEWNKETIEIITNSGIRKIEFCDYFDDDNWKCSEIKNSSVEFEMKEGKLFQYGHKLVEKHKFKF